MLEFVTGLFSTMSPELRGALELWLASALLAGLRWVLGRYVPAGPLRSWLESIDWLAHFATASSRALGQRPTPEPKRNSVRP